MAYDPSRKNSFITVCIQDGYITAELGFYLIYCSDEWGRGLQTEMEFIYDIENLLIRCEADIEKETVNVGFI